jgi:hypothetical protein
MSQYRGAGNNSFLPPRMKGFDSVIDEAFLLTCHEDEKLYSLVEQNCASFQDIGPNHICNANRRSLN